MAQISLTGISRGVKGVEVSTRVLSSDESRTWVEAFDDLKSIEKQIEESKLIEDAETRGIKLVTPRKRKLK